MKRVATAAAMAAASLLAALAVASVPALAQPAASPPLRKPDPSPSGATPTAPVPAATASAAAPPRTQRPRIRFLLANDSGQIMESMQTAPAGGGDAWSENLLGRLRLPPGNGVQVNHPDRGTCLFDLRVAFADGHSEIRRGEDLCALRLVRFEPPPGAR